MKTGYRLQAERKRDRDKWMRDKGDDGKRKLSCNCSALFVP
jgi:hypothetical protein